MVYVRIITAEALNLLAHPITEFFSAHLIKIGPLHAFFCLLSQAVFMLPLRCIGQGENLHAYTLTLTCYSYLGN